MPLNKLRITINKNQSLQENYSFFYNNAFVFTLMASFQCSHVVKLQENGRCPERFKETTTTLAIKIEYVIRLFVF